MTVLSRMGDVLSGYDNEPRFMFMPEGVVPCFDCLIRKCDDLSLKCSKESSGSKCSACEEACDACEIIPPELRAAAVWCWNRISKIHLIKEGMAPSDAPCLSEDILSIIEDALERTGSAWRKIYEYLGSLPVDGIEDSVDVTVCHCQEICSIRQIRTLQFQVKHKLISCDVHELRQKLDDAQPPYCQPETLALSLKDSLAALRDTMDGFY